MQYIDSAMVGALGANASASIGLVASTTWLFNGIPYAVSAGFSVQVAHSVGAKNTKHTKNVVKHGLITAIIISLLMCVLGLLISKPLPALLGGSEEINRDASIYFITYALMIPFFQINSLSSSYLQCAGDMVTPSILNAVMCVLDVIFNALFIPQYGVLGAGMGTTLACIVISVFMMAFCYLRNKELSLLKSGKSKFSFNIIKTAFKIGTPVAVQEIAMCGAMVATTMIVAPLGAAAIAANSFAITAESLCYMPGYGIGNAATTLVGRSFGAGDFKTAKRYGNICTAMGGIFMGLTGLIMIFFCPFVFMLLTPVTEVRELATEVLRIGLLSEPLFGVSIVAAGALRGTGDTFVPSIMNLGSIWIVRIGLALLLVKPLGLHGVWIAMAVELCVRGLILLVRQITSKYYKKM
ncbi:MAG: MATE family efflux transporter [Ruminococcaceae bacterium]|nr:MATE family efflux transporter [Oscillospiraceae bacterium]